MATYAFSGGVASVKGAGQKNKIRFGGTWADGEDWSAQFTSQISGDFTLGKGNIAGKFFTAALNFKDRVVLGYEGGFAISAIGDPTGWEEQNVGTSTFIFSTQYGITDTVYGLSSLTGRLFVFGEKTIQAWAVDADPSKWVLTQVLDNSGTGFPDSVQSIGELDVIYVDRTGFRSIRSKELSGDAFVNDVGTPIDSVAQLHIKQAVFQGYEIVSTVNPTNKNYMAFVYNSMFVLAQYPLSKITAWSTFDTTWTDTSSPFVNYTAFDVNGANAISGLTAGAVYAWRRNTIGSSNVSSSTQLVNGTETLKFPTHFTAQGTSVTINGTPGQTMFDTLYPIMSAPICTKLISGVNMVHYYGDDNWLYRHVLDTNSEPDVTMASVQTPWLSLSGGKQVQLQAIEVTCVGSWIVQYKTDPRSSAYITALMTPGSTTIANVEDSSTASARRYAISGNSAVIQLRFESTDVVEEANLGAPTQPKLCSATVVFAPSNEK